MVVSTHFLLLSSAILLKFLFNAKSYIEYILQRILTHNLFESKNIFSWSFEIETFIARCYEDAVFVQIIHSIVGKPTFAVRQRKFVLHFLNRCVARNMCVQVQPDIIEVVF